MLACRVPNNARIINILFNKCTNKNNIVEILTLKDKNGLTCLMWACFSGTTQNVEAVLHKCAQVFETAGDFLNYVSGLKNKNGKSSVMIAELIKKGANERKYTIYDKESVNKISNMLQIGALLYRYEEAQRSLTTMQL